MPVADGGRRAVLDRGGFATGLPVGPLLILVGYAVLRGTGVTVDDRVLAALVAWPVVPALLVAAVLPGRRRWWLSLAAGCAVGIVVTVLAVVGLISAVAHLLSDPAGTP